MTLKVTKINSTKLKDIYYKAYYQCYRFASRDAKIVGVYSAYFAMSVLLFLVFVSVLNTLDFLEVSSIEALGLFPFLGLTLAPALTINFFIFIRGKNYSRIIQSYYNDRDRAEGALLSLFIIYGIATILFVFTMYIRIPR